MRKPHRAYLIICFVIAGLTIGFSDPKDAPTELNLPTSDTKYAELTPEKAFDLMMEVLTHKRCVNCHPADDYPRQGEDSHIHNFGVQRGPDNHGMAALKCQTCHQNGNNNYSGVPGAPEWSLAPRKMAWQGLSRVEIARSMLNPDNNGGRTLEETVHHLTEHELVLWAWEPGVDANGIPREKPPVPKAEYIKAVKAWAEGGAPIPEH